MTFSNHCNLKFSIRESLIIYSAYRHNIHFFFPHQKSLQNSHSETISLEWPWGLYLIKTNITIYLPSILISRFKSKTLSGFWDFIFSDNLWFLWIPLCFPVNNICLKRYLLFNLYGSKFYIALSHHGRSHLCILFLFTVFFHSLCSPI